MTQEKQLSKAEKFNEYRSMMNERIWAQNNKVINRLFNLDQNTYTDGALSAKTKEMLGLVASMTLRCEDCINYHLGRCNELGVSNEEMMEIFSVATIVSGTIMIPHLRKALEYWQELRGEF
jgi:AhpD family alkylhydroperoxidase